MDIPVDAKQMALLVRFGLRMGWDSTSKCGCGVGGHIDSRL